MFGGNMKSETYIFMNYPYPLGIFVTQSEYYTLSPMYVISDCTPES